MTRKLSEIYIILKGVCNMRVISFGDLYIDYYLSNDLVLGICGGKTNANVIANLAKYYDTAFYGVCGNDAQGDVAIKSLSCLGVDTSNIERVEGHTKAFFIDSKGYSTTCPYCGRKLAYKNNKYDPKKILPFIQEDDFIVIDNLNVGVLEVLNNTNNKAFLDIGYLGNLLYLSLDEIIDILKDRFEIINMNGKVYDVLRNKFKLDLVDFYELINPNVLIITRGKKSADIVHDGVVYEKIITDPVSEVDVSGAGDSFFSEFIRTIIDAEFSVNEKIISLAYMRASSISRFCITNYGARTHLEPLTKIDNYIECICTDITVK